jgi:hypothetical protein
MTIKSIVSASVMALAHIAILACLAVALPPITRAEGLDVAAVVAGAVADEKRRCHNWMSSHPDVASGYTVSIDDYCLCEANLLVGSMAPEEVVRLTVAGELGRYSATPPASPLEKKLGERRNDAGLYCLGELLSRQEKRSGSPKDKPAPVEPQ